MFINPVYKWLAVSALVVALVGTIYVKGRSDASLRSEIARLETDLMTAKVVIEAERRARAIDEINAVAAQARLDILERKAKDLYQYADALEDGDAVCLDGNDTDRLRDLWGNPAVIPSAAE
jgi:hypothetical protein